mgnify:CR=1 FL=1
MRSDLEGIAPHPDHLEHIAFEGRDCVVLSPEEYEALWNKSALSEPVATQGEVVGLFWQTSDGKWHFIPGSTKRGDIHDNGRPMRVAYLGEEAK